MLINDHTLTSTIPILRR